MNLPDLFKRLGPGFVTGASDDDPAGIGTYVQTGAQFGYAQLWIALFSFPVMAAVQEMCGRIGMVTGQGLASVIRRNYAPPVLLFIVGIQVVTNTINIGADLSAMAESTELLWHVPYYALLLAATFLISALIVLVPYRYYAAYLKFVALALLTYVVSAFTVHVDWKQVALATVVPHFEWSKGFVLTLIAVFGVTISPYEFFWQASEEVEELVYDKKIPAAGKGRPNTSKADVRILRNDTIFGMFFSNAITFFIIITAAATLHAHGHTDVQSATQAAQALRPLAGPLTFILFTAGIVSSGLLAIPVMAGSSAYAVAGAFDWPRSLGTPFWREWRFYGIIVASCFVGLLVNATHVPPFKLLYYSAVLNGIVSPPLLFIVTQIAGNGKIMREQANSRFSNFAGYSLCAFMSLALAGFVILSGGKP
ncbi:MAG: divalent metal cation transporter [Candidatus Eremiobacteraeota bacterium]|nr:divalent metal cation transporter [Candidatus Eremiobacteraeota bacterium]